jgi:hypothetical protein
MYQNKLPKYQKYLKISKNINNIININNIEKTKKLSKSCQKVASGNKNWIVGKKPRVSLNVSETCKKQPFCMSVKVRHKRRLANLAKIHGPRMGHEPKCSNFHGFSYETC